MSLLRGHCWICGRPCRVGENPLIYPLPNGETVTLCHPEWTERDCREAFNAGLILPLRAEPRKRKTRELEEGTLAGLGGLFD